MKFFPHDNVRKYQDELIKDVKTAVEKKKVLLANAPTGIGKTAAVISPALEYAMDNDKTIFFLTPRHTQHKIIVETLQSIYKQGAEFTAVDLIGKNWMCAIPGSNSLNSNDFSQLCKHLRDNDSCKFYNNTKRHGVLTTKAEKLLNQFKEPLHVEEMVKAFCEQELCPYYSALETGRNAKVIIGDYYHVFSEGTRSALFKQINKSVQDSIMIVDEAHNLPGRIRELLSARTSSLSLSRAAREAGQYDKVSAKIIQSINTGLSDKGSQLNGEEGVVFRDWFMEVLENSLTIPVETFMLRLNKIADRVREERKPSSCGALNYFIENWMTLRDEYVRLLKREEFKARNYYSLTNHCLDPSIITSDVLKSAHSSILMSGTLQPLTMYADLFGVQGAELKSYSSPFPGKNRLLLAVPETTTKYSKRSHEEYGNIAVKCAEILNSQKVNTAVFFPSYDLRNKVYAYLRDMVDRTVFLEHQGMSKTDKEELVKRFKGYSKNGGAVLLGVVSGNFSEGLDYPGEFLEMIIIVGIPLAKPDLYTKALIQFYQNCFGKGWEYGYTYPAINKVLQASGRAIRSETDKGAIVLLDERYIHETYLPSLPEDVIVTMKPVEKIKKFFQEHPQ